MSIARLTVGILLYDDITCVAANFSIRGATRSRSRELPRYQVVMGENRPIKTFVPIICF